MKKFIFLFSFLALLSCRKNDVENGFEMEYELFTNLPAGLSSSLTHYFVQPPTTSSYQNFLLQNGYTEEKVISIKPKFLTLDLLDPGFAEYGYLQHAYLYIKAPGLADVEIGFLEFIRDDVGDRLNFIPNTTEVSDYLTLEEFQITLALQPELAPQETTSNRLRLTFQVFAEPR